MNWVIHKSKKIKFHTDLSSILNPLINYIDKFNWLITDLEFIADESELIPINFTEDYFLLNPDQLRVILSKDVQFVWGVISAIPKEINISIANENHPFSEGEPA